MMKRILIGCMLIGSLCWGQGNQHTVTIRRLNTAEENLVYEHKRTIGLRKYEIEKQLKAIRAQRESLTARNRAAAERYNRSSSSLNYKPPQRVTTRVHQWRPPAPDWKDIEHPDVLVKGSAKIGDQEVALVSGGKIIYPDDVFTTTFQGEERYWRCTEVDGMNTSFERINPDGTPWPPVEPKKPWWDLRRFFQ